MINFAQLRARHEPTAAPPRVITVRLSAELHEALKNLAHRERVSLNMLCIAAFQEQLPAAEPEILTAPPSGADRIAC